MVPEDTFSSEAIKRAPLIYYCILLASSCKCGTMITKQKMNGFFFFPNEIT